MSSTRRSRLIARSVLALLLSLVLLALASAPGDAAAAHQQINGTGSSWAYLAISQWTADVKASGLSVTFSPNGSAQGRRDFASGNSDFGVSDIGYQGQDTKTGADDTSARPYAYLPIVGGGTAFPYQIKVGGKRITNLRLSGDTLAKIFTNQITDWSNSQITADNNGRALPAKPIIPVVHSEGAGSTAQFTQYLASQYPAAWTKFNGNAAFTEYYPRAGNQVAQNGSDGVMNYVTSAAGDGTIGYDEYAYALSVKYPVVKLLNPAGYFTLPTQYNDAVALTKAIINTDKSSPKYLLQDLSQVYTNPDPRSYPLSSYSYAIIPTSPTDTRMNTAKRQTLADFLFYSVCGGQSEMGPIGYSALPLNLVKASFEQVARLKTADPAVDITSQNPANCNNPTFDPANPSANKLAEIDPAPVACDKVGQGPCVDDTSTGSANVGKPQSGSTAATNKPTPTPKAGGAAAPTPGAAGAPDPAGVAAAAAAASSSAAAAAAQVDPDTGLPLDSGGADSAGTAEVAANPTTLAAYQRQGSSTPYAVLATVALLSILIAPPLLARRLQGK